MSSSDEFMMVVVMACILLAIGMRQKDADDRIRILEYAKPDTVYVVSMPDSLLPKVAEMDTVAVFGKEDE